MGHAADGVEDRREVGLLAAEARGNQQFGEPRRGQLCDGLVGQPTEVFGFTSACGQTGDELVRDALHHVRWRHGEDANIPFSM